MSLSRLEAIYSWINNLSPNVKTLIIIVLSMVILNSNFKSHTKVILQDYTEQAQREKHLAEEYTKIITPIINSHIESILSQDKEASNVILLNYHNTITSTHGLSYRYLTSLTERKRGLETKSCIRMWKELEYINYGDEIERINDNKYLRMDSIHTYAKMFPNLVELLERSGASAAAFYPIVGIESPIGMIVVLYQSKKEYYLGYYNTVLSSVIQPLSSLLDYNSVKEKFKKDYEYRQKKQ